MYGSIIETKKERWPMKKQAEKKPHRNIIAKTPLQPAIHRKKCTARWGWVAQLGSGGDKKSID